MPFCFFLLVGIGIPVRIWALEEIGGPVYELRFWSKKFGVSPNELRCAVSKVGVFADDVARELGILEVRDAPLICP
jgi:hypothetical protein